MEPDRPASPWARLAPLRRAGAWTLGLVLGTAAFGAGVALGGDAAEWLLAPLVISWRASVGAVATLVGLAVAWAGPPRRGPIAWALAGGISAALLAVMDLCLMLSYETIEAVRLGSGGAEALAGGAGTIQGAVAGLASVPMLLVALAVATAIPAILVVMLAPGGPAARGARAVWAAPPLAIVLRALVIAALALAATSESGLLVGIVSLLVVFEAPCVLAGMAAVLLAARAARRALAEGAVPTAGA